MLKTPMMMASATIRTKNNYGKQKEKRVTRRYHVLSAVQRTGEHDRVASTLS